MEIRPWRAGDEMLAVAAERHISSRSLTNRFMAGVGGALPNWYLRHVAAGPREVWDAHVAAGDGHLLGWAEYGRASTQPDHADIAVIVADPWQRQGIASALIRALVPRANDAGVTSLAADVLAGNHAAHALLASVFGPRLAWQMEGGSVHYELPLSTTTAV